jgi:polar amino acid transport system substrate-binding protein
VQAVGANSFYPQRLNAAKPELGFEPKLHFTALYNGACTRLGEKEWNETANKFIDQIKSNGKLASFYAKWMKAPVPTFPDSVPGVPFTFNNHGGGRRAVRVGRRPIVENKS